MQRPHGVGPALKIAATSLSGRRLARPSESGAVLEGDQNGREKLYQESDLAILAMAAPS
jgi:hypothetical protein